MRAAVLRGGRMVYRDDVPEPTPGPGQVLVAVRACGICGSDLHFAAHCEEVLSLSEQMEGLPMGDVNVDLGATSSWVTSSAPRCWRPVPAPKLHLPEPR
jgi:hypothetical protein